MIVMLVNENDTLWVDPSSRTSKFGTLPVEAQGVDALVIAGKSTKFIRTPITVRDINHRNKTYFAEVEEDGTLRASCLINSSGEYDRLERQENRNLYEKEIREKIRSQIISSYPLAVLKNYEVRDIMDHTTNFTVSFDLEVPKFIRQIDTTSFVYFEPFLLTESRLLPILPVRPRKYAVQYPFENRATTTVTWKMPKSFEIVSMPPPIRLKSSFAEYEVSFELTENSIHAEMSLLLKNDTVAREELEVLEKFAKSMYAHSNAKIILRKKN